MSAGNVGASGKPVIPVAATADTKAASKKTTVNGKTAETLPADEENSIKAAKQSGNKEVPTTPVNHRSVTNEADAVEEPESSSADLMQRREEEGEQFVKNNRGKVAKDALENLKKALEKNKRFKDPKDIVVEVMMDNGEWMAIIPVPSDTKTMSPAQKQALLAVVEDSLAEVEGYLNEHVLENKNMNTYKSLWKNALLKASGITKVDKTLEKKVDNKWNEMVENWTSQSIELGERAQPVEYSTENPEHPDKPDNPAAAG